MRFLILSVFILIAGFSFFRTNTPSLAGTQVEMRLPQLVVDNFSIEGVTAKAYGVFDVETGDILFSYNPEEHLPIASVTKLFTAAKAMETGEFESIVITEEDVAAEGRAGKLEVDQNYKIHELIFPLLMESSNDAAVALERRIGEVSIAGHELADTSGLSSQNVASVAELSEEVRKLYLSVPHIFDITKLKQYVGEYTGWINNSPVADLPGYMGGKHGYTIEAKKTLAAIFAEDSLGGREFGYIILGSDDVREDVEKLRKAVESSVHIE